VDRIKYSVMTRLAPYPSLVVPLARLRGEGELVDSRTDLRQERNAAEASPKLRHRAELLHYWFTRTEDVGPS